MTDPEKTAHISELERLQQIMAALRHPETGCPWDIEQDFASIAPYTIEEAYEVADAIERNDMNDLRGELGDLLLQVVFHSQMASEVGAFTLDDVARAINDKMVSRHPHVFGDQSVADADAQTIAWEELKARERAMKSSGQEPVSALDDVALALPALMRAQKLQKRAARVGFDWPTPEDVLTKLDEELEEVKEAITSGDIVHIEEELGDLLFVAVNLARKLGADAEEVLTAANRKFTNRFKAMEHLASERGQTFSDLSLEEQEALWQEIKKR